MFLVLSQRAIDPPHIFSAQTTLDADVNQRINTKYTRHKQAAKTPPESEDNPKR
jgi:hypothetical protein